VVHRDVGVLDQFAGIAAVVGIDRNADAGADVTVLAVEGDGLAQGLDEAARNRARAMQIVHRGQQHDELVTAETRQEIIGLGVLVTVGHHVFLAQARGEPPRDFLQ
jgi:hypothetical protein